MDEEEEDMYAELDGEDRQQFREAIEENTRLLNLYNEALDRGDATEAERIKALGKESLDIIEAIARGRRLVNPSSGDSERETEEAMALRIMNEQNERNERNQNALQQREVLRQMNEQNERNQNAIRRRRK